jgi:hypothetical protein
MPKLFFILIYCLTYIFILLSVYLLHITFFKVDVVLYSAVFDVVLAVILSTIILYMTIRTGILNGTEKNLLVLVWLFSGVCVAVMGPTLIDRSLSFYVLEKLQQRGGGIRQDAFAGPVVEEYIFEHRLMDIRLTEQLQSDTITIKDGCVKLTAKGDLLAGFSRHFRNNYLPRKRLILDQYTDALTDPFRHSTTNVSYQCQ